ncbi:Ribonuclease H-like domain containing protein [Parasponia andersonii]|uniref:Ribonuclease H-like domain containing protein n=1 Tax=Parasponia andersonii TaxID=3476 RepID=A0A2P5DZZ8_PARAD|nr:Ribonuclease H-like domain containing protein [Parasponia andersonii]
MDKQRLETNLDDFESNSVDVPIDVDLDDENDGTGGGVEQQLKHKRKLTSQVWKYFEMLFVGPDKKQKAKCKLCRMKYFADSKYGTGNLKRHIDSCVRTNHRDVGQLLISQDSGLLSLGGSKFDIEKFRNMVTQAIVMHDLPFNFVEYKGIRSIFSYLYPAIQLVSRNTAKADTLKLYKKERALVKSMIEVAPGRVSFTSDLWTSLTSDGYLCLTCHYIDKNWCLQKKVLSFTFMPPPHSGLVFSEKLYSLLCEWGLESKDFSITLDNAASNDISVEMFQHQLNLKGLIVCNGDHFHMRCIQVEHE